MSSTVYTDALNMKSGGTIFVIPSSILIIINFLLKNVRISLSSAIFLVLGTVLILIGILLIRKSNQIRRLRQ
jgi:hypothetical protein